MKLVVSSIMRNEADRHLERMLACVAVLQKSGPTALVVTDDASEDATAAMCRQAGAVVQTNERPLFWEHEGRARQAHYDFTSTVCEPGDWVLALDADETVSKPECLHGTVEKAAIKSSHWSCMLLPLYEFWTEDEYRVDGWWFGTLASRLYRWQPGGRIADKEMGCGSEPGYVQRGRSIVQDDHHLLHWGYLRPEDRARKHAAYASRLGGHGHNLTHVDSIITEPTLRRYELDGNSVSRQRSS